jgi:hypothetical protein
VSKAGKVERDVVLRDVVLRDVVLRNVVLRDEVRHWVMTRDTVRNPSMCREILALQQAHMFIYGDDFDKSRKSSVLSGDEVKRKLDGT